MATLGKLLAKLKSTPHNGIKGVIETNFNYYKYCMKKPCVNNVKCISYLTYYHHFITKDYTSAKKYYLMAIEKGNSDAMYNLAFYYETNEKNYEMAIKYYLMAIEAGDTDALFF
jgi:TPR repeat protein